MDTGSRTAAIVYSDEDDIDAALAAAVAVLRRAGRSVGGLLQRYGPEIAPGKRSMVLDILPHGGTIPLSDVRGPGVRGCILDSDALACGAMAFREATLTRPDLLIASRFSKQEVAGGGLRAEIAEAIIAGIPLLVPMRAGTLPAWHAFLGGPGEVLAPRTEAILAWAGSLWLTNREPCTTDAAAPAS